MRYISYFKYDYRYTDEVSYQYDRNSCTISTIGASNSNSVYYSFSIYQHSDGYSGSLNQSIFCVSLDCTYDE